MFYKERLLNDSNTEGLQSLFCPQKLCNYLVGRHREPSSSLRCTGVRQEATDKFEYNKLRLDLRKKNFHLKEWLNFEAGCPKQLWTPHHWRSSKLNWKRPQATPFNWPCSESGPSNSCAPMTLWNYILGTSNDRFYWFFFLIALSSLSALISQEVSKLTEKSSVNYYN